MDGHVYMVDGIIYVFYSETDSELYDMIQPQKYIWMISNHSLSIYADAVAGVYMDGIFILNVLRAKIKNNYFSIYFSWKGITLIKFIIFFTSYIHFNSL